jgi:hypothetical protein
VDERSNEDIKFAEPPEGLLTAPENRVIAHMDHPDGLPATVDDLAEAGFDRNEIFVLCGQKGAERLDVSGRHHGLVGRIYRLLEWTIDAHEVLLQSEQHLAAGGLVIGVPADEDNMDSVSRILREHGAHYIHYFGKNTFRRLGA